MVLFDLVFVIVLNLGCFFLYYNYVRPIILLEVSSL